MLSTASPIAKTAFDALQAKRSALDVGYQPLVVDNEAIYKDLLIRVTADMGIVKRQTPLVNAGYAIRILGMSHVISGYLSFHRHKNTKGLQIILLGCGLDVIGLWATSLSRKFGAKVKLFEVDTKEVCDVKKDILIRQGLVEPSESSSSSSQIDKGREVILRGNIIPCGNHDKEINVETTEESPNNYLPPAEYTLVAADLRNISKVSDAMLLSSVGDSSYPTLVLSELVLTYLPPQERQELLSWCASHLCTVPDSMIAVLEPLGSSSVDATSSCVDEDAVVEGYKRSYCRQFDAKLQRGKASISTSRTTDKTCFYPLGNSNMVVEQSLEQAGFDTAHGTYLGSAASHAMANIDRKIGEPTTLQSPEIFDEHAALTLHLRSYSLACGFSEDTEALLRRFLCPWFFSSSKMGGEPPPLVVGTAGQSISLAVIQKGDENYVRDLFQKAYVHLFEEYPAVRKMAKTALKTDLAVCNSEELGQDSSIGRRYREFGGIFVVAIRYNRISNEREVLGCVGVRPSYRHNHDKSKLPLEIFRLVVDATHRGQGIGSVLLEFVERFALARGCEEIFATTPGILKAANRLYEKCGFEVNEELSMGALVMRTYVKRIGDGILIK